MKKMRLISGCAALALAITGLGGCTSSELENETESASSSENFAAVYICEDNAIVFLEGYEFSYEDTGISIYKHNNVSNKNEFFYGNNIIKIKYKDKDELEDKIEAFIGEDGNITYYDEIGNAKTLS